MRDPADSTSSPYEVLGLAVSATQKEINDALAPFLRDPAKKPRMREAMEARKRLTDPVERLVADFFRYEVEGTPDGAEVAAGRRAALFDRWEAARKDRVGADPRVDHNVAVLTWWWAVAEENRLLAGSPSPEDSRRVDALWLRAIPNLTFLCYLPGYWEAAQARLASLGNTLASGPDVAAGARRRVLDEASVRMSAFATLYQEKGAMPQVQRWNALRTHFDVERTSTEELAALIREGKFRDLRPCGPLLAAMFNGREFVYGRLASGEVPRERVAKLLTFFSPVGRAQMLVDEQRYDEAIAVLDGLPEAARAGAESQGLYAVIHAARAKALAGKDETLADGINGFVAAAKPARKAGDAAVRRLVETVKDVAAGWINRGDYASAIRLLDPMYDALSDVSLRDLLVVAYCDRGGIRVVQGRDTRDVNAMVAGLKDIQTSVTLDAAYKRGREHLGVAQGWLAQELARNGYVDRAVEVCRGMLSNAPTDWKKLTEGLGGAAKKRSVRVTLTDRQSSGGLSYSLPGQCTCCTEAEATQKRTITGSYKSGNTTHTLRVNVPYCTDCDRHVRRESSRTAMGCMAFIALAVFFFAWLVPRIEPSVMNGTAGPWWITASFWGVHFLAAICIAIRVGKLFIPDPRLSSKHAVEGEGAWVATFGSGTMTLGFRNPGFGIAFALANRGLTSKVEAT